MTDDRSLEMPPRAEFADRLEASLLEELGRLDRPVHPTPTTEHVMTISSRDASVRRTPLVFATAAAVIVAIIGIVLLAAGRFGSGQPAATSSTSRPSHTPHQVTFVVRWTHSAVVQDCPSDHAKAMCFNRFDLPATSSFEGDLAGYGYQAVFWNDRAEAADGKSDHLEHIAAYNVFADVAGCGSGEFMLMEMLQYRSGPSRDLNTGTYVGTWQIVADSGRGTLTSISGSGTSTGIVATAPTVGRTLTGTIECP